MSEYTKDDFIERFKDEFLVSTSYNKYGSVKSEDFMACDTPTAKQCINWLRKNLPSIGTKEFDKALAKQQKINNQVLADKCDELDKFAANTYYIAPVMDKGEVEEVLNMCLSIVEAGNHFDSESIDKLRALTEKIANSNR